MYAGVRFILEFACASVQVLASTDKILPKFWVTSSWKQHSIFNAGLPELCSMQVGSRQLSELSLLSSPSRVGAPRGGAGSQDSVHLIWHAMISVLPGYSEGHDARSGWAAFSSSVHSPVRCLPSRLPVQSLWKDSRRQSPILRAVCSVTSLAVALAPQGREKMELLSSSSACTHPARWPSDARPEKPVSACWWLSPTGFPFSEEAQPALLHMRFRFREVLWEAWFGPCSLVLVSLQLAPPCGFLWTVCNWLPCRLQGKGRKMSNKLETAERCTGNLNRELETQNQLGQHLDSPCLIPRSATQLGQCVGVSCSLGTLGFHILQCLVQALWLKLFSSWKYINKGSREVKVSRFARSFSSRATVSSFPRHVVCV